MSFRCFQRNLENKIELLANWPILISPAEKEKTVLLGFFFLSQYVYFWFFLSTPESQNLTSFCWNPNIYTASDISFRSITGYLTVRVGATLHTVLMRRMKLEPIIQSEESQKDKHQYSILTHIYGIKKDGNDNPICRTEKETQMYRAYFLSTILLLYWYADDTDVIVDKILDLGYKPNHLKGLKKVYCTNSQNHTMLQ